MLARVRPNLSLFDLWHAAWSWSDQPSELIEATIADRFGFAHALLFPSARSALRVLLESFGWHEGEVLSPAYVCAEVPYAVTASGNRVKFVDSATDHFLPNSAEWNSAATPHSKMAIIAPLFGYPIDLKCISIIREQSPGVFILFDEAQSYGVTDAGGLQVREADGALLSLGLGKMVTAVSGGILLLRDSALHAAVHESREMKFALATARHTWMLSAKAAAAWLAFREPALSVLDFFERRLGISVSEVSDYPPDLKLPRDIVTERRPSSFQARVGFQQLVKLETFLAARHRIGQYYEDRLCQEGFRIFEHIAVPTWPRYPFAVSQRDEVIAKFHSEGVQISRFLPYSCAELPAYRSSGARCTNASLWARGMINLPNWFGVEIEQAERIVQALLRLRDKDPGRIAWPQKA